MIKICIPYHQIIDKLVMKLLIWNIQTHSLYSQFHGQFFFNTSKIFSGLFKRGVQEGAKSWRAWWEITGPGSLPYRLKIADVFDLLRSLNWIYQIIISYRPPRPLCARLYYFCYKRSITLIFLTSDSMNFPLLFPKLRKFDSLSDKQSLISKISSGKIWLDDYDTPISGNQIYYRQNIKLW